MREREREMSEGRKEEEKRRRGEREEESKRGIIDDLTPTLPPLPPPHQHRQPVSH